MATFKPHANPHWELMTEDSGLPVEMWKWNAVLFKLQNRQSRIKQNKIRPQERPHQSCSSRRGAIGCSWIPPGGGIDGSSKPKSMSASGPGQCTPNIPSRHLYKLSGENHMMSAVVMLPKMKKKASSKNHRVARVFRKSGNQVAKDRRKDQSY